MISNDRMRIIKRDVIGWSIYISWEIFAVIIFGGARDFRDFALFYCLNIGLFYFNSEVVFPYGISFKKAAFILIPIFVLAELAVYVFLGELISHFLDKEPKWSTFWNDAVKALWRGVQFLGLSILLLHR